MSNQNAVVPAAPNLPVGPSAPFVARIRAEWRKSLEGILEVGKILVEAKAKLGHGQYMKMIENDLPFGYDTANKIKAIAEDKRMLNMELVPYLPPSWYALHKLTRLDDSVFYQAIKDGRIYPGMERKEVDSLIKHPAISAPTVRRQSKRQSNGDADRQESAKSTNSPVSTAVKIIFTTGEFELVRNVMMVADRTGLVQEVAKRLWPSEEACLSMPPPDSYELAEKLEMEEVLVGLSAIGDWNTMEGEFSTESTGS
ncbi:MAG: DUF3102 domain-containing protein [Magnetococcales bacterium]|nr:DUF3102 domain-containing protein [Magnetococcales bacterium]